eukprot:TRINITY_DN3054_c3_g1_i1.p1 TRINITY_DN3054_c3_g1~~TRINITY_DN3054_c3_g1_i1.p1  ORF type:complete len:397 (+),score=122.09 TRINITY_DN3054_c3_g1_i1:61-1251(+)
MFIVYDIVWVICFIFSAIAVGLSVFVIYNHLRHYTEPRYQKPIIRILLMVPIYSIDSWLSLTFPKAAVYFDVLRDCYEAYVLYQFFVLLVQFCDGETILIAFLEDKESMSHPWPFCCLPKIPLGKKFFIWCKACILQFVIVNPFTAVIAMILEACGVYDSGSFSPTKGYIYLAVVTNTSITIALYFLVLFYMALQDELKPFRPVPKFLCIKAVIFFTFWQDVLIGFLVWVGLITTTSKDYPIDVESTYIEDGIVCIEMLFISIAMAYAFGYEQYRNLEMKPLMDQISVSPASVVTPVLKNFGDVMNVRDVVNDTVDVFGHIVKKDDDEFENVPFGHFNEDDDDDDNDVDNNEKKSSKKSKYRIPKPGGTRLEGTAINPGKSGDYGGISKEYDSYQN